MVEAGDMTAEEVGERIRAIAAELGPLLPVPPQVPTGTSALRLKMFEGLSSLKFSPLSADVTKKLGADFAGIGKGLSGIKALASMPPLVGSATVADIGEWVPPEVTIAELLRDLVDIQQAEHDAGEKRARRTERWAIVAAGTGIVGCVIAVAQLIAS
jgi:hypothetical protein